MKQNIVVLVTAPNAKQGHKIARALLQHKLAACVNIIDKVSSLYWWQGKIQKDNEVLLIIKTHGRVFKRLTAQVQLLHPYTVPEIIALPITQGEQNYLTWIQQSLKK